MIQTSSGAMQGRIEPLNSQNDHGGFYLNNCLIYWEEIKLILKLISMSNTGSPPVGRAEQQRGEE